MIFIFIFVFIIIIALITLVISYGGDKDNKKFTFQYKHKKQPSPKVPLAPKMPLAHIYSSLFPYISEIIKDDQYFQPSPPPPPPQVPSVQVPSVVTYEQENQYPPKVPFAQPPPPQPKVPTESPPQPQPKVPSESPPQPKVPSESPLPISESNQKTESNIHNCEDNYIWNKYLNKCITTECPIETHANCAYKGWIVPDQYLRFYNSGTYIPNGRTLPIVSCPTIINRWVIDPSVVEELCETLRIPVPEEGQTCWSECQNRCVKPECTEMTMEECKNNTVHGNYISNLSNYYGGMTCEQMSMITTEFQLQNIPGGNEYTPVLQGEICWSDACNKCVKPYVKPLTREQGRIKHNLNPNCFPNNKTCMRDSLIGSQWSYKWASDTGIYVPSDEMNIPNETCEEWSTFTDWEKYNLNPVVLPGEVCWNPCTGGCVAPINW
jgi:hypothetical protein